MAWLALQNVGARILGVLAQIILARLLAPSDYGLIALATASTALVVSLADFGIDQILVQRQRTMRLWLGPAFWMSLSLGCTLAVICALSSFAFAQIYHEGKLIGLISVLALAIPVNALATLPLAELKRRLRFQSLALVGFGEVLSTQVLTIFLAALGAGAYSFAIPAPIIALAKVSLFWWMLPQTIGRRLMLRRWKFIFGRGISVVAGRIISTVSGQIDLIVLGMVATTARTGVYFFAYRVAVQPLRMLAGSISGVMVPALASLKGARSAQTRAALSASRLLAYVIMPTCFLQIAIAGPLIRLVFGEQWQDAAIIVQLLSLGMAFDALSWISGSVVVSQGRYTFALGLSAIFSSVLISIVISVNVLCHWERPDVAVAVSLMLFYVLVQPFYSYAVFRREGVSLREIWKVHLAPAALAAAALAAASAASSTFLPGDGHDLLRILLTTGTDIMCYLGLMFVLARAAFDEIKSRLLQIASASR